jgi:cytochrome c oxidase subunit 2
MILAVVIVLLIVGSLLFHFLSPWWFTPIASNWSTIDDTVNITFLVTGIVFVLINSFLAYCIFKFRHKKGSLAHYEPENKKLEVSLVVITALGVIAMLAPGLFVWANFIDVPEGADEVEVVGQQWRWGFRYPGDDGIFGISDVSHMSVDNPFGVNPDDPNGWDDRLVDGAEMRLPVDRPVKMLLRSKDVLHNFAVPEFRVKMDMVPGMVTYFWLTPTVIGEYDLLCEELCGLAHFAMRGRVIISGQQEFDDWLAQQVTFAESQENLTTSITTGRSLYTPCAGCHGQQGEGNIALNAPKLSGLDPWYTEQQIKKFKNGMRGANEEDIYGRQMAPMAAILANDAMIRNVADYIASLPSDPAETTIIGNVENGRRLFMTCGSCHGRKGEGIWSVFAPRLSGKDDWYLARQLKHFKDGIRGSHPLDLPGRQMALLSITLKDDQAINDVIAYINTLPTVE